MTKLLGLALLMIAAAFCSDEGQAKLYRAKQEIAYNLSVVGSFDVSHLIDWRNR